MISKFYCEILVLLRTVQNLEILDLAMAQVEKINITVTYFQTPFEELAKYQSQTFSKSSGGQGPML